MNKSRMTEAAYVSTTAALSIAEIEAGDPPWIVIGGFLDDWRRATTAQRELMVCDPVVVPTSPEYRRWAALLAAIVEWLSHEEDPSVSVPHWTSDPGFVLPEPWFLVPGLRMRLHQLVDSPAPFRLRNIFTDKGVMSRA